MKLFSWIIAAACIAYSSVIAVYDSDSELLGLTNCFIPSSCKDQPLKVKIINAKSALPSFIYNLIRLSDMSSNIDDLEPLFTEDAAKAISLLLTPEVFDLVTARLPQSIQETIKDVQESIKVSLNEISAFLGIFKISNFQYYSTCQIEDLLNCIFKASNQNAVGKVRVLVNAAILGIKRMVSITTQELMKVNLPHFIKPDLLIDEKEAWIYLN